MAKQPMPTENMGKGICANCFLGVGDSGADFGLPTYRHARGFVSAWQLTFKQRLQVLFGGKVWLSVVGSTHPPVSITTGCPLTKISELMKEGES